MKNDKYLDELLKNKSYEDLSEEERAMVMEELGGKIEFLHFQKLVKAATTVDLKPKSEVKNKLNKAMKVMYPSFWQILINIRVPAYMAVPAMILLMLFVYWIKEPEKVIVEKQQIVQAEPVIDTIIVEIQADTVFIENIRKVEVPVYITLNEELKENDLKEEEVFEGSNLSEQSALIDLVTSAPY